MPIQELRAAPTELRPAVALFRGLADPTRLAIIQHLAGGPARVADLVDALGLPQSTVSTHLACLRDCDLVTGRPEGRQVFYALAHPELLDLLQAAEQVLDRTGAAVALCPTYGTTPSQERS
jgi:ArsR family transcriptional regulator, cadmium/lead-responsive transcriptional repressor